MESNMKVEKSMIGGSMKTTSRFALAAVAGLLMGGVYAAPVKAADLGGNCCADLEERIADLEATTVRKGNKVMSLTLSGHVNRQVMWYDDGSMTGVRSGDNIMSHSRFRLLGNAKVAPEWSIGYYQEFEFSTGSNAAVSQLDDRGFNSAGGNLQGSSPFNFAIRQSHWYIKNDRLGTVSVGRLNTATKDMPGIELGNIAIVAASDMDLQMGNFLLRPTGQTGREGLSRGAPSAGVVPGIFSGVRLSAFRTQSSADNLRTDGVRYDSPTIMGYTLSAAAGDDYKYDIALRYAGDWNGFKIATGTGYYIDMDEGLCDTANAATLAITQNGCISPGVLGAGAPLGSGFKSGRREQTIWKNNASIWHQPSGLFVSYAYWKLSYDGSGNFDNVVQASLPAGAGPQQRPDSTMWWVAGGVRRNFFGIGDTSIFGEYGKIDNPLDGTAVNLTTATDFAASGNVNFRNVGLVTDSQLTRWGVGIVQKIDKANTDLYLHYINYSPEITGCAVAGPGCVATKQSLEDIRSVQMGAIVRF
jgi:hypothetical protein